MQRNPRQLGAFTEQASISGGEEACLVGRLCPEEWGSYGAVGVHLAFVGSSRTTKRSGGEPSGAEAVVLHKRSLYVSSRRSCKSIRETDNEAYWGGRPRSFIKEAYVSFPRFWQSFTEKDEEWLSNREDDEAYWGALGGGFTEKDDEAYWGARWEAVVLHKRSLRKLSTLLVRTTKGLSGGERSCPETPISLSQGTRGVPSLPKGSIVDCCGLHI